MVPQALHSSGGEWQSGCGGTGLTVQDAGDLRVGVMHGQPPDEVDGVLVGAQPGLFPGDQRHRRSVRAPPFQRSIRSAWPAGRSRVMVTSVSRVPSSSLRSRSVVVGADQTTSRSSPNARIRGLLFRGQGFRFLRFAAGQFGLGGVQRGQRLLPRGLQATCHQPVLGVDGEVAAFGPGGVVAGPDWTSRRCCSRTLWWPSCSSRAAARQAVTASPAIAARNAWPTAASMATPPIRRCRKLLAVDEVAGAGAVVAGGVVMPPVVVDGEFAAAGPAGGQVLQQRAALPDGAGAGLVRDRADVPADPLLVGQEGCPSRGIPRGGRG